VGAAAGFDGGDARGGEGGVRGQEIGVFAWGGGSDGGGKEWGGRGIPGEDVVCDGSDGILIAEGEAEGEHEGGFAGADGSAWMRCAVSRCFGSGPQMLRGKCDAGGLRWELTHRCRL